MAIADGQINVTMNARGVDTEIARLQRNIDNFGAKVTSSGRKASEGVDNIGRGATNAANQVDTATTRMAQSILKQTVALQSGGRQAAEYYRQMAQLRGLNADFLEPYINQLDKAQAKNKTFIESIAGVRAAYAAAATLIGGWAGQLIFGAADSYTKLSARVKNASESQAEYYANLQTTIDIAREAQAPLQDVANLNASLTTSLRDQGVEQEKINSVTKNVALSLRAMGAGAAQSGSVITQLSQAFASGVLRGDEFNSMAENAPVLQRALADSLGVSIGQLRAMAAEGELTADVLVKAFSDGRLTKALQDQNNNIVTISGAWQALKNEILLSFGAFEQATGFFNSLAVSTNQLAQGIGIIREWFKGDALKGLNDELKKTTDRLAAYDKTDPLTQLIVGGPETREKMIADIKRLSAEIRQLTAPAKKSPASLETKAVVDKSFQDELQKEYEKQLAERRTASLKAAQDAAKIERDLSNAESAWRAKRDNEYQDQLRKSWEKNELEKQKLADDLAKEDYEQKQKYLDMLSKQAEENYKAAQDEIKRQADEMQRQYERTQDILTRTILDSLNEGFGQQGLSIAENFIQTLKNMFKSVVLEPVIRYAINASGLTALMAGVSNVFSPSATTSDGLVATQNSSIIDRITDSFKSINTTFSSSIENLGVYLSNGQGGLADKIGGFLGQYSSQIADGIGYLGAAYMLSQGNVIGAGLTAAGTYFGGPIGGPIGGAIGSAIGGLFGKKKRTPRYSAGVSTSYADGEFSSTNLYGLSGFNKDAGGRDGLAAASKVFSETISGLLGAFDINSSINTQLQFFKRKGAWGFASSTIDGVSAGSIGGDSVYSKDAQEAFNNLISQFLTTGVVNAIKVSKLPVGVKGLFDDLTDQTQISNMIAASVNLASHQDALASTYNLNADLAGKVATASGLAGDSLIAFVNALTTASMSQKSAASVLLKERAALTDLTGAVPTTLKAFDDWLKSINTTTTEGQAKFAEMFGARDRVSSLASAFDSITTARDNALYGLLSQSEQMAISQAKLRDAFAEVNAEVPGSRDELVKWVNGLDLTTEAGLKAAMAVPALVDAFQQIEDNANSTTNALRDMSRFTNLADYRFYKGVANNYGNVVANDYVKASGVIQSNSNGKSTVNGADVDVLAELKQMRQASQEQASLLNRILKVGLKVQA